MTKCYFCGKELPQGNNYCTHCDHETNTIDPFEKTFIYKKRSVVWFLLPVFIGIIGGVIAYAALRNSDPLKGKYCLIIGVVITVAGFVLNLLYPESGSTIIDMIKI